MKLKFNQCTYVLYWFVKLKRYDEIDSLRGFAALAVIISHGLAIFALPSNLLDVTPLYLLWSSHEVVIFFFVLSGFVLTLLF